MRWLRGHDGGFESARRCFNILRVTTRWIKMAGVTERYRRKRDSSVCSMLHWLDWPHTFGLYGAAHCIRYPCSEQGRHMQCTGRWATRLVPRSSVSMTTTSKINVYAGIHSRMRSLDNIQSSQEIWTMYSVLICWWVLVVAQSTPYHAIIRWTLTTITKERKMLLWQTMQ